MHEYVVCPCKYMHQVSQGNNDNVMVISYFCDPFVILPSYLSDILIN